MNDESNSRLQIIEALRLISSERQQIDYEQDVPQADVTAELLCCWFDDGYHPADPQFVSCFTPSELEALARFNEFYDTERKQLPPGKGTVRSWLESDNWKRIMAEAQKTLSLFSD